MALDGIFLHSLLNNIEPILLGSKIDKINQPEKDEIILTIRKERKNHKLLISASSKFPRMHFTEEVKENPLKAPMFLMVLRKYLIGGKITKVHQKDGDRIVILTVEASDEMGFNSTYSLIIEIMGRHSNITLVRDRDNKVMESIKHITPDINTYRVLYPGVSYMLPPATTKLSPINFTEIEFISFINENHLEMNDSFFFKSFTGISKTISKELFNQIVTKNLTLNNIDSLYDFLKSSFTNILNSTEFLIYKDDSGIYKDFYCYRFKFIFNDLDVISYDSPSIMLDNFFNVKDKQERLSNRSTDLQKLIHTNIERCKKKSKILNENIRESQNKEDYKIKGDLLTSYIYSIKQGDKEATLLNFYSENSEYATIPLDEYKTPSENIQSYYKKYNKLKKSEEWAIEQLKKNEEELEYLNSVLTNIQNVDSYNEIEQIKTELMETGYIKYKTHKKNIKKTNADKPLHFISSTGFDIYVGKNNIQNDYLSLKFAHRNDLWLHAKEIPGSHVIIKGIEIDDTTIAEAAIIAAYYSKGKTNSKVPIDYTEIRNLRKPNGAKPGMVIYYTNKTIYADPQKYEKLNLIKK
ncbi:MULTISPECIES: NFACT RNA binding domain-containing protein [Clostridium]|uniref:Rqc2 homolog RqcH n=1 Tax=Clostridium cibarium TaxID=2762247 RepID=A0ABR8PPE4_9CLOT|nr:MULTISPECIES: NFACT RNA binding domain-containing protein [Clostridium]MBD7910049.1 NFACT family protein [Clostridium cibarium]